MNLQKVEILACTHNLDSSPLFAKRIGISGTLPNWSLIDLGECHCEPCSDGSIFEALSIKRIASIKRKKEWATGSLLTNIAYAEQPVRALIDTDVSVTELGNHTDTGDLRTEMRTRSASRRDVCQRPHVVVTRFQPMICDLARVSCPARRSSRGGSAGASITRAVIWYK